MNENDKTTVVEFKFLSHDKRLYRFSDSRGRQNFECRSCGDLHPTIYYESESMKQAKKDLENRRGTCQRCLLEFLGEWTQQKQRRKNILKDIVENSGFSEYESARIKIGKTRDDWKHQ